MITKTAKTTKSFDLITALVQAGYERGIDTVVTCPATGEYQTVILRKTYGVEDRINDRVLSEGLQVEVQVTYHNHMCYGVRVFYSNGKVKDHEYGKRAYNAIRETCKFAGYEI